MVTNRHDDIQEGSRTSWWGALRDFFAMGADPKQRKLRKDLVNWQDLWDAHVAGTRLPALVGRDGQVLRHTVEDSAHRNLREIYLDEVYTGNGFYEPRDGDVVLDVGANVGFFTFFLKLKAPGITVHSFEPAADTAQRLADNVRQNHLEDKVTVYPMALSGAAGMAKLLSTPSTSHRSLFHRPEVSGRREEYVNCQTLDWAVEQTREENIALLKLDVEGAELEILQAASAETLQRVERVAVEYHEFIQAGSRRHLLDLMKVHGFRLIDEIREGAQTGVLRFRRTSH